MSCVATLRTQELGIRIALDARSGRVVRLIPPQGALPTLGAIVAGTLAALRLASD